MSKKQKGPEIDPKILDELLKHYEKPEDFLGREGIFQNLQKALLERILKEELTTELGYSKHSSSGINSGNSRNGYGEKTLKGDRGHLTIEVPRDRNGEYEPKLVPKNRTRFDGFDDKIISLYSRGMSTRDIQDQLKDLYGVEISATLISNVTDAVIDEVKAWQSRPLDRIYPIVYLDALVIKVKEDRRIINKAFYLALGVNDEGEKELLGIWISKNEGAKFWLSILTEIKERGVEDILIACVDGLTGFPEAIEAVYPETDVQLCTVHMVRNSLRLVSWKCQKKVASDLRKIYTAKTIGEAELALDSFADKWDSQYPSISKNWKEKWELLTACFVYPEDIRRAIYTTNAIESLNMTLRKFIKQKRVFPTDDAALKQLYLALQNVSRRWTKPIPNWQRALNCFTIMFGERLTGKT